MSDPTPAPPPTPKPGIDWNKLVIILLTGLASLVSGLHFGQSTPAPTPAPVPNIVPKDDKVPDQKTVPDQTTPPPAPTDPVACITVSDSSGRSLGGADVDPGTMIVLTSEKARHGGEQGSIQWTVNPAVQKVVSPDGSSIVIVTPPTPTVINVQQAVALNNKIAIASVTVKSGKGSQPPPHIDPIPDQKTSPTPIPTNNKLGVAIIEVAGNRSPAVATMFASSEKYAPLQNAGIPSIWYDVGDPSAIAKMAVAALTAANVKVAPDNAGFVVYDLNSKSVAYAGRLTSIDDLIARTSAIAGRELK